MTTPADTDPGALMRFRTFRCQSAEGRVWIDPENPVT